MKNSTHLSHLRSPLFAALSPMANHEPSAPPPPYYSVAVHAQPPLRSYEEVVYGLDPGLKLHAQPHYIPQYPPPVAAPQVTQPPIPPKTKKRCCGSNSQCYSGLGAAILLLAVLGLAIWLGVRYGTTLATTGILDGEGDLDGDGESLPPSQFDTCPNNTVECNAVRDCQLGTDETNCVRFGEDNGLQVKTAQDRRFLPVCYRGWGESYADRVCAQLGFRQAHDSKAIQTPPSVGLTLTSGSSSLIQGMVEVSSSCPNQRTVSLQCVACGQPQSTARIIGGEIAQTGQWPWQLSLHLRDSHTCGAVLISPDFALTAAHCFQSDSQSSARNWKVYGGVVSLNDLPQPYLVEKIILNKNYNSESNDQDIALLKLTSQVAFNDKVQPICLPAFNKDFPHGTECWTSGFGTTEAGSSTVSKDLMEVNVNIIRREVCNRRSVYGGSVTANMICAGHLQGGKDSCQGDSGGPLVCKDGNLWYLVGLTSWGDGCARRNRPGVYTNVRSLLPWIYSSMQLERP